MSGFAGFFAFPDPLPDAAPLLGRLGRALLLLPPATGDDPKDTLLLADHRAGLTGTCLERSGDGALALAFDGTIHNRAALSAELAAASSPPLRAMTDGELLLALYARHGASCVERLRGPFALVLWDGREGTMLLARDPVGLRTLYYFHGAPGKPALFATGVRALMAGGVVPRQLDGRGLYGFFRHGAVPEPFSLVAGVRALENGERISWQADRLTRRRDRLPTRIAASDGGVEEGAAAAKSLRAALLDSVDQHLADGVPTAIFLGGGIGSAALLALAHEAGRTKNLRSLTVAFDDAASNETDAAQRAAQRFGVPHTHLRLDAARAREWFDDLLPALDQPGVHAFPLYALCRFAREEGIKTALAGIGAGELFGDLRFHAKATYLLRASQRLGRARAPLSRALGALVTGSAAGQLFADFLSRSPTPAGAYTVLRGVHAATQARAMVARFADPTGCADPMAEDADTFPTFDDAINALELRRHLRDQRLRDADTLGRAHGVEWRLPFADGPVMATLARLPAAVRLRGEHWNLLRESVPEAAPWENTGAPHGLRFPARKWNAGDWGAAKPADASGVRRSQRTWEQKWSLFLFRRWWRQINAG